MLEPTAFTCVPSASHSRRTIGSREDVAVTTTSAPSSASSARRRLLDAFQLRRLARASGSRRGRARTGARRASPRDATRACTPAPRIASVRDSGRASSRVATADTAAVRTAVIAEGVDERARLARHAVEEGDEALVAVEPERRVAGRDAGRLQRIDRVRAGAVGLDRDLSDLSPAQLGLSRRHDSYPVPGNGRAKHCLFEGPHSPPCDGPDVGHTTGDVKYSMVGEIGFRLIIALERCFLLPFVRRWDWPTA